MNTEPTFITAGVVAQLIGFSSGPTFLIARERLEDECGFPLPMPTSQRPLKWRRDAVLAWQNSQGWAKGVPVEPVRPSTLLEQAARP